MRRTKEEICLCYTVVLFSNREESVIGNLIRLRIVKSLYTGHKLVQNTRILSAYDVVILFKVHDSGEYCSI